MAPKKGKSKARFSFTNTDAQIEEICAKNRMRLRKRGVVTGRVVDFPNETIYHRFEDNIRHLGYSIFTSFKTLGLAQRPHMIEFYSLLDVKNTERLIKLRMYTIPYTFSFDEFSKIMQIPITGKPFIPSSTQGYDEICGHLGITETQLLEPLLETIDEIPPLMSLRDKHLKLPIKFLNKLIISNILPRKGQKEGINPTQLYILYCLATNHEINLFAIMLYHMATLDSSKRALPYGIHLNLLFKYLNFSVKGTVVSMKPLNATFFTRSKSALEAQDRKRPRGIEAQDRKRPRGKDEEENEEALERIETGLAEAQVQVRELSEEMTAFRDEVRGQIQGLSTQMSDMQVLIRQFIGSYPPPQ